MHADNGLALRLKAFAQEHFNKGEAFSHGELTPFESWFSRSTGL